MSSEFIVTCATCYLAIGDETQLLLHVLPLSFIFHKYKVGIALALFFLDDITKLSQTEWIK